MDHFYRLIKPVWARPLLANGSKNPKFKKLLETRGNTSYPDTIEGFGFEDKYLKEKNDLGYNIFWFPNHPSKNVYETSSGIKFLNGKLIDVFDYVFVDFDLKEKQYPTKEVFIEVLKSFAIPPTFIIDSGHGIHGYWKISNLTLEKYVEIQLRLINKFRTDVSVWTVLQLLRRPGFTNTKEFGAFVPCNILEGSSSFGVYEVGDLIKHLTELTPDQEEKAKTHVDRLNGKLAVTFNRELDKESLPDKFIKLLQENEKAKRLFDDPNFRGDRSEADMSLCHLLFSNKFSRDEAYVVILNTQKSLEKQESSRVSYAELTVSKVFIRRQVHGFQTVTEYLTSCDGIVKEPQIFGPKYLDFGVLGEPWRRKELLGIIAGPGKGKTAFAINIIHDTIMNNNNNDLFVFFSLEMTKGQIIQRWLDRVGNNSKLGDRLIVLDNATRCREEKPMYGLQEIYEACKEIKQVTGKRIGVIVVDHFHLLSTEVDLTKPQPHFGATTEAGTGYGTTRNLSFNLLAKGIKALVTLLDSFCLVLTQTTKEKGKGDLPIGVDGCYGVSQYEWIMDRVISLWQPIARTQNQSALRILAFQYVKLREKRRDDKIHEYDAKLLTYDMDSGMLRGTDPDEYQEFSRLLPIANEIRRQETKKEGANYSVLKL